MADYYVNSMNGNDSYDGLAPSYDGLHGPWKTLAHVVRNSFLPGDTIDGGNKIYREFVTFTSSGSELGGYITFQNFIVEGTLSFNGGYTYYGSTYVDGYPWINVSGEVWSKICGKHIQAFYENEVLHTPVVTTSTSEAEGIDRGFWTIYDGSLYYRASDGAAPSTHVLLGASKTYKSSIGMLIFSSSSWIHIKNVTVRRRVDDNLYPALTLDSCSNMILENCTAYHNGSGIRIKSCLNVVVKNANAYQNYGFGLGIGGNGSNISIQGRFSENGRIKNYIDQNTYDYVGDGDNIGIGYEGGTIGTITIHDSVIEKAGPGIESGAYTGNGIFVGTTSSMTVDMLNIYGNIICDSHATGIRLNEQLLGFNIHKNIIKDNSLLWIGYGGIYTYTTGSGFTGGLIANNVFYHCLYNGALFINPLIAAGTYIDIKNNIFYDNGGTSGWFGDLFFRNPDVSRMRETNNLFWRSEEAWGTGRAVCNNSVFFDLYHIIGSSEGYWEYVATSSQDNVVDDPLFIDPDSDDFRLGTGSAAIAAGTNVYLSTDYQANAWRTNPSIGAIEYYKISGVISPKTIGGKHYKVT